MLTIRRLEAQDAEPIAAAFQQIGWNKSVVQYEQYLAQQANGQRSVLVAFWDQTFAGYLTINWRSEYAPFREQNIPEIQDLNVLPQYRRRGIGTSLMDEAEQLIAQRSPIAGIGVGLYADYGAAQRLYILRGYVPDGKGLVYGHQVVAPGAHVVADDDLVLYLTKVLDKSAARY